MKAAPSAVSSASCFLVEPTAALIVTGSALLGIWRCRDAVRLSSIIFSSLSSSNLRVPSHISLSTMDASTESSIDGLAARTTVKCYGNIRHVT